MFVYNRAKVIIPTAKRYLEHFGMLYFVLASGARNVQTHNLPQAKAQSIAYLR